VAEDPVPAELRAEYVTDRIGYRVPARRFVIGILFLFCGLLAGVGVWLARRQRLEHLAWISVVLGSSAAIVIVAAGQLRRHAVPPTASYHQILQVLPDTGEYAGRGTLAVYQPDRAANEMRASGGARIDPDLPQLRGTIRQLVWSDGQDWSWGETVLPSGVQMIETRRSGMLPGPIGVAAELGPEGLRGRMIGAELLRGDRAESGKPLEDAVVVFPLAAPLAADLQSDGSFVVGSADRLAEGQFFLDTLIDDEQRRRKRILAAWHEDYRQQPRAQPMLVGWSEPMVSRMGWPDHFQQTGAALVVIPLELTPTPAGTRVQIPAPLIACESLLSAQGQSTVYDNKLQRWNFPNTQTSVSRLRFELPREVLPLQLEQARLTLDCNIPSRQLRVQLVEQGEATRTLLSRRNASGRLRVEIEAEEPLRLTAEEPLVLQISVGPLERNVEEKTMSNSSWSIRETSLDVGGITLESVGSGP
jgi:hypothetical protein